jgi:hypothetical protein
LVEKAQAFHDPPVEIEEFGFGESIDVEGHGVSGAGPPAPRQQGVEFAGRQGRRPGEDVL